MMVQTSKPNRVFTIAEANAMLPLVRSITRDLVRLSREVVDRHQRVEHLRAGRRITTGDPYDEELAHVEEELTKDRERLHEYVQELRQLGVEPKSGVDGIVDFPDGSGRRTGLFVLEVRRGGNPALAFAGRRVCRSAALVGIAGFGPLVNRVELRGCRRELGRIVLTAANTADRSSMRRPGLQTLISHLKWLASTGA